VDRWKYFDITHRDHVVCNPTSMSKLQEMIELFTLSDGARVLDIACGKAELLLRLVDRYRCSAVGVDLSPYFIQEARERATERAPNAKIDFQEIDGANYDGSPESFDLVICLGASWIWQGHVGTLKALARWTKPGGEILVGEPFWSQEPEEAYLKAEEVHRDTFGTHFQNVQTGIDIGLTPLYSMVSNGDDWDRYEALQWRAAEIWATANPHDPDRDALLERCRRSRDTYLRWGRKTLGWALYFFRK
jgi:SAM-dependent methyltransferase